MRPAASRIWTLPAMGTASHAARPLGRSANASFSELGGEGEGGVEGGGGGWCGRVGGNRGGGSGRGALRKTRESGCEV